jgi:hypothetical protein
MKRRLEILERLVDAQSAEMGRLKATVAAYQRGASGRPPGCATCRHLLVEHLHDGACQHPGCACQVYDSSDLSAATA